MHIRRSNSIIKISTLHIKVRQQSNNQTKIVALISNLTEDIYYGGKI
jgi:hypothetical protein